MIASTSFAVPDGTPVGELCERIAAARGMRAHQAQQRTVTYYDTFDGRLYEAGDTLEAEAGPNGLRVTLRELGPGKTHARELMKQVPKFGWKLPAGPMRDRIVRAAEVRALQPLVSLHSTVYGFRLLGAEDKTIARIELDVSDSGDAIATVVGIAGYRKGAKRATALLQDTLGLDPVTGDPLLRALAAEGRSPTAYSSKLEVTLTPGMPAQLAIRALLGRLLEILTINEPGTRADIDSEFLHDYRVGVRRARSLLGRVRGVLPADALAALKPELAWLGELTSPARDMDVYLLHYPEYRDTIPRSMQDDLEPLRTFLKQHKRSAYQALNEGFDSQRYRRLMTRWRDVATDRDVDAATAPSGDSPIVDVASAEITRSYKRLMRETARLSERPPAPALHQLRKDCKRLRYLIEAFRSLYPSSGVRQLMSALKPMQSKLGDIQDTDVQIDALRTFSGQMFGENPSLDAASVMAMGVLVERLEQRQRDVRLGLQEPFERMLSKDTRKLTRALFGARASETRET